MVAKHSKKSKHHPDSKPRVPFQLNQRYILVIEFKLFLRTFHKVLAR